MLTSLHSSVGLALAARCQKLVPRITDKLATGNEGRVFNATVVDLADLRKLALVIILQGGLSLDLGDLKKVGRPAILMSCLPATCEIIGYVLLAPCFLGVTRVEAAVMGSVLAAVSSCGRRS